MPVTINTNTEQITEARGDYLDTLTGVNDALRTGFRAELETYRNNVTRGGADDATNKTLSAIISDTRPQQLTGLTDAEKLDLLLANQRNLAIVLRETLRLINALNAMLTVWRGAHARVLRALRNAGI